MITQEMTKDLVRDLPKKVFMDMEATLFRTELYFNGERGFKWFTPEERPFGWINLKIPMKTAYYGGEGEQYDRHRLGDLDKFFYDAINRTEVAYKFKYVKKFREKKIEPINNSQKYLKVSIEEYVDGFYLRASMYLVEGRPQPTKKSLKGKTGEQLGEEFSKYKEKGDYYLSGIRMERGDNMLVLQIGDDNIKYWEEFIRLVGDFDKYMHQN